MISDSSSDSESCVENGPHASLTHTSVGGTGSAGISLIKELLGSSGTHVLGVKQTVQDVTKAVCLGIDGILASTELIVESLVWCFVARRSLRKVLFEQKEYDRFVRSMRETARRITAL